MTRSNKLVVSNRSTISNRLTKSLVWSFCRISLYFLGNIIEPFPKKIRKCVKSVQKGLFINFRHLVGQPTDFIEDGGGRSWFWTIGGWILTKSNRLARFRITKFSMASSLSIWRVNLLISLRTVEGGAGFGLLEAEFWPKVLDSKV